MNSPSPRAQPDYLTGLGLQQAPFLDQIDERFFYADPALVQRLDLLQHLIQFGDMLLGVVGPSGSGKSTLLRQLLLRGGTLWRCCRLSGAQIPQPAHLLAQLADCFDPGHDRVPERLQADLLRSCEALRHSGQIIVVVVDDAHLLPDAALKNLLELAGSPPDTLKLLRIVLFSEPGLERRITQGGWHSPVRPLLHTLQLPAFNDHQTAAYLMYRLAAAGYSGASPFSLTEVRALHKAAGGLPGRLNALANETLMEHAKRGIAQPGRTGRRFRLRSVPRAIIGAAVAGIVVAVGLGWYSNRAAQEAPSLPPRGSDPAPPVESPTALPMAPAPEPEIAQSTPPPLSSTNEQAAPPPASPDEPNPSAAPRTGTPGNGPPDAPRTAGELDELNHGAPTSAPSAAPPADTGPRPDVVARSDSSAPPSPTAPPADTSTPSAATASTPAGAPDQLSKTKPAAEPAQPPAAETAVPPSSTVATPPDATAKLAAPASGLTAQSLPAPKPPPASATPQSVPTAQAGTRGAAANLPADVLDAAWLLARPPGHYTLQLIGVRSPASLRGYLRDHAIPGPVAYFRTRLKGGDWYVLVQGDYVSQSAAHEAVAALPAGVRKDRPWPRRFSHVHTDIRKATP